jgi:hypothetical protein
MLQVTIHAKEKNLSILGAYYASENVSSAEFPDHLKLLMNRLSANNTTNDSEFKPILLTVSFEALTNNHLLTNFYRLILQNYLTLEMKLY